MIKNWKNFNEDVYWGNENTYETDEERNERIKSWVEKYVDEQVGLEIVNVSVSDKSISVHYKKGHRYEDRERVSGRVSDASPEEIKKMIGNDWYLMAEDMIDEMKRDNILFLEVDHYYIDANENGYYIENEKEFEKQKTGTRTRGFGG